MYATLGFQSKYYSYVFTWREQCIFVHWKVKHYVVINFDSIHVIFFYVSGLLGVFCKCLLENLERLPGDARTMVGILTYDSSLHFYNLNVSA